MQANWHVRYWTHVHVHLIPLQNMAEATFEKKVKPTPEEFEEIAKKIQSCF